MLGGDVGRMRRERWAQALEAGTKQDRALAESLRAASEDGASHARIQALLEAFFQKDGEGGPHGGENGGLTTKNLREKFPTLEDDLRREQESLAPLARAQAGGADA